MGEERLISISGNPALTVQAPKIVWQRRRARIFRAGLPCAPAQGLREAQLTGEYATDASDAAGTLLLDMMAGPRLVC